MTTKKGKLIDLFKTPTKIKKAQYSSLDNSLKVKTKLDNETTDMMIILYYSLYMNQIMIMKKVKQNIN